MAEQSPNRLAAALKGLVDLLEASQVDAEGRIRVEDVLSAAAAAAGQEAIRAVGEYDADDHPYIPGALVLSDRMNKLLADDAADWAGVGPDSLFGVIRQAALAQGYAVADFPSPDAVFRATVAGVGKTMGQAGYGRVALSVDAANAPRRPPLQDAWELQQPLAVFWTNSGVNPRDRPMVFAYALATILVHVRQAIDPGVATRLVLETLNGMAKMAPMTARHWAAASKA